MSIRVAVVLVACACACRQEPHEAAGAPSNEALAAASDARSARLRTLGDDGHCDASSLTALAEIAGGTYRWDDAIARAGATTLDAQIRTTAVDRFPHAVYFCLGPARRDAARALRRELDVAFARPGPRDALRALLAGDPGARRSALEALAWAPTRALRDDLGRLAGGEDVRAWRAYLAVLELPAGYPVTAEWRQWIDRSDLDALLGVAGDRRPATAPGPLSLDVRRAAMEVARERVLGAPEPPPAAVRNAALALSRDVDPVLRREATRLLDAHDPIQRARLDQLAADAEPTVQLAARAELAH